MKKRLKSLISILAIISIIALASFNMLHAYEIDQAFLNNYGGFDSYQLINKSPIVYNVFQEGNDAGYLVFEQSYGYQSTLITATLISQEGVVKNIKLYQESETPAFMYKIINSSFFDGNFFDKNISHGFSIDTNVNAVSGATISSRAITNNVHNSASFIGKKYLDINVPTARRGNILGKTEIALIIMLFLSLFASKTKNKKLKLLVRVYSLLILGFWLNQFITFSAFASIFGLNFPSYENNLKWYILVVGTLLLILFSGKNLYCSYICPFGSLQDLEFRLAKLNYFRLNLKVLRVLSFFPGLIAYFALVLALGTSNITTTNYEPFSLIFGRTGTDVQWLILPIVLIGALFVKNFYCKFGCPVGFTLNLIVKLRGKVMKFFARGTKQQNVKTF